MGIINWVSSPRYHHLGIINWVSSPAGIITRRFRHPQVSSPITTRMSSPGCHHQAATGWASRDVESGSVAVPVYLQIIGATFRNTALSRCSRTTFTTCPDAPGRHFDLSSCSRTTYRPLHLLLDDISICSAAPGYWFLKNCPSTYNPCFRKKSPLALHLNPWRSIWLHWRALRWRSIYLVLFWLRRRSTWLGRRSIWLQRLFIWLRWRSNSLCRRSIWLRQRFIWLRLRSVSLRWGSI